MKLLIFLLTTTAVLALAGCDKCPETVENACIDQKIEAFKTEPGAYRVVKITSPARTLYWFVDSYADAGEEIVDIACNVVCITDLEGITDIPCDDTIFDGQQEVIWQK